MATSQSLPPPPPYAKRSLLSESLTSPATTSIIIPTIGRRAELLRFLDSLLKQTIQPNELIIVDAGTDQHLESHVVNALKNTKIDLRYQRSTPGTSLQRNIAINIARGEILFFFDDDIVLTPDYLEKSLACFDQYTGCVLGTFIHSPSKSKWAQRLYDIFLLSHAADGDHAKSYRSGQFRTLKRPSKTVAVPVASGGRTAYRRECFDDHRFTEYLPGYTFAEDTEISYRIGQRWNIVQCPSAQLDHQKSNLGRVSYSDRIARIIYARHYFFLSHKTLSVLDVSSHLWANIGMILIYCLGGLKRSPIQFWQALQGLTKGYYWCLTLPYQPPAKGPNNGY